MDNRNDAVYCLTLTLLALLTNSLIRRTTAFCGSAIISLSKSCFSLSNSCLWNDRSRNSLMSYCQYHASSANSSFSFIHICHCHFPFMPLCNYLCHYLYFCLLSPLLSLSSFSPVVLQAQGSFPEASKKDATDLTEISRYSGFK